MKQDLNECVNHIPSDLKISDTNWKLLNYAILAGKNALLSGPTGTGKTKTMLSLMAYHDERPSFNIPMGATQDARSTLVGNTHYDKEQGTFVVPSYFIRAIQTPYAIVVLEEITRASIDAERILMSVLDEQQRFLRIDEDPNTPEIQVAEGVSFLATANIGNQYTATRELDLAFKERFIPLQMGILTIEQEMDLNIARFPKIKKKIIKKIVNIAQYTRTEYIKQEMQHFITSKQIVIFLELLEYHFTFEEAFESLVQNLFDKDEYIRIDQFKEQYEQPKKE